MEPKIVADYACGCGEGPLWHEDEQRLYWIDISPGHVFRYDPVSGAHEQCREGDTVGGFTIQADGSLLLFTGRSSVTCWRDGEETTVIAEMPNHGESRFNDAIADPEGRVFSGSFGGKDRLGRLYRLDTDLTATPLVADVPGANGMGFSPDLTKFYFSDSLDHAVFIFDYDRATGALANRRVFVSVPEEEGNPDGMTVDAEGCVWLALYGGNCLVRYAPDGTELTRIHFPAKKVTSLTFGGPDYTDMYVTSAGGANKEQEGAGAGALFRLNLGIQGVPEFRSRIAL